MTDAINFIRNLVDATSHCKNTDDASVFIGHLRGILAHVEAQAAEIKRLRKLAMTTYLFEEAPCFLCGYNGLGYYQPEQHPCAALYHEAMKERR